VAKLKAKSPLVIKPKLNSGPVMPGIMSKSLKALFVQLNAGYDAIAARMQVNPNMGATIALDAPILCFAVLLCCAKLGSSV
jgi:hypothetical protein